MLLAGKRAPASSAIVLRQASGSLLAKRASLAAISTKPPSEDCAFKIVQRNPASTPPQHGLHSKVQMTAQDRVHGQVVEAFLPPDDPKYHPYRLRDSTTDAAASEDWISQVDLEVAAAMSAAQSRPLRFLVLYGSLRKVSYSRLLAFEMARLLEVRGCWLNSGNLQCPFPLELRQPGLKSGRGAKITSVLSNVMHKREKNIDWR